jgi:hypothetical protein
MICIQDVCNCIVTFQYVFCILLCRLVLCVLLFVLLGVCVLYYYDLFHIRLSYDRFWIDEVCVCVCVCVCERERERERDQDPWNLYTNPTVQHLHFTHENSLCVMEVKSYMLISLPNAKCHSRPLQKFSSSSSSWHALIFTTDWHIHTYIYHSQDGKWWVCEHIKQHFLLCFLIQIITIL